MRGFGRSSLLLASVLGATSSVFSCRDEVVQTAERVEVPDAGQSPEGGQGGEAGASAAGPLDCELDSPADDLPLGAEFGEGDTPESWPAAGSTYAALDGPGIYVAARDTFRLYVNGHLVAQSERARSPLFVPLSLLPGENVIALTVSASAGTPAALVQLDELERTYESNSSWKVSTAPSGNWMEPGYDDSAWGSARELGAVGSLPGCDPVDTFPTSGSGRWIGPDLSDSGPIALRQTIRIEPVGFASGTTGGGTVAPTIVSSWDELVMLASSSDPAVILLEEGDHDFRRVEGDVASVEACQSTCSDDPDRQVLQLLTSGSTCAETMVPAAQDERTLKVSSNKTIVGLGRGAALRGVSFDLGASENVIVRNVAIYDINQELLEGGDAFTLTAPSGVWIDHVTMRWVSDAFVDALTGTKAVTISYALFEGGTDAECTDQERWAATFTDSEATIHHCRFDQVSTRAPMGNGSAARLHLFNNVYSNTTDWTVGAGCSAQVLLEGSVFENVEAATRVSTCSDSMGLGLLNAVAGSNLYRDDSNVHLGGDGSEPHDEVFAPGYAYPLEPATEAWPRVVSRAGAGGPWALPLILN